jgi:hypothetical protein
MSSGSSACATIDRALGATEALYTLLDQVYCLNFVVFAELEGRLDAERLRAALTVVQDETPLLRARIEAVGGPPWFKPVPRSRAPLRPEPLPVRTWKAAVESELQRRFDVGQAPLARFLWFKDASRKSVAAMSFHHAIGDGRSGLSALLDVLRRATVDTSPPRFKPVRPSSQSLDQIRQKPAMLAALQGLRFWAERGRDALQFAQQLPGYDPTPLPQRAVRILHYDVGAPLLARLQRRARDHGTTVHGALGAAQLLAVHAQFPRRAARRLALNSLADLRGVLGGGLSERDLGLYVTTLCTVHALDASPDFWALACELRDMLMRQIDSGDANLINGIYPPFTLPTSDAGLARLVQTAASAGPPSTMLTNLGKLDDVDLGDALALRSLGAVVSPPAQHPICVTATSHGGRMYLKLLYDECKMGYERAEAIGDALMAQLRSAAA